MQNYNTLLSKFPLVFTEIPANPEEGYLSGTSIWKDGKLISYDWGDGTTVYIAHYTEMMPTYDPRTNEYMGDKPSVRAMSITVPNPVTREKLIEQGRKDIYNIMNVSEELRFTNDIIRTYMSDPENEAVKTYEGVTRWLGWQLDINEGVTADVAKSHIIQEITDYDKSDAVNQFFLGNIPLWLTKDTRMGLMNSITMEKNVQISKGVENPVTTLWYGDYHFEIPCDLALQMLTALELYALECYNVTAKHKVAVGAMTDVEDILGYDYTKGYPEKLHLSL